MCNNRTKVFLSTERARAKRRRILGARIFPILERMQ